MKPTVILLMFGVGLIAGAPADCDKLGSNAGTELPHTVGDYVNININEHRPVSVSNGKPPQDVVVSAGERGQFAHHGTNVFFKPHIVLAPGNSPVEPLVSVTSGSQKLDNLFTLTPQPIPELPLIASEPETIIAPTPDHPIVEIQPIVIEPVEDMQNYLPAVIPPAPELPPLQSPIAPFPIVLEEAPLVEPIPQPIPDIPIVAAVPKPLVVPNPESPVIHPVIPEIMEDVNREPLMIPPAPELPPLQLPTLPVPVTVEENPLPPVQPAEPNETPIESTTEKKIEKPYIVTPEVAIFVPEAPVLPPFTSSLQVIYEQPPKPVVPSIISNEIEIGKVDANLPIIASSEVNLQPILVAEFPQYPYAGYPAQIGAQKELVIQPCSPQGFQPAGLIQIHQYVNGVPQGIQAAQIVKKK